jgi:hypothetical protein|tara:strand:+ start:249 stop:590 length:342 start_codon:yes stop_codon:yes gene_type:complete
MPEYVYENPKTGELVNVWQSVHEDHSYEIDGVVFNRIFTVPNAAIDTKIDPYSQKDFKEKAKGSTVGELWDQSKELSQKREEKEGVDPVKTKFFKDYASKGKGNKHPQDPAKN